MPRTVVLGVVGADAHVVGITIIERALTAAGFDVENLGVQTSPAEFVEAAAGAEADAVLVSSLYGHAERDCEGLHDRLAEAGVDPVTYVGGNLAVGQADPEATRERFAAMGFDRVFGPEADAEAAVAALRRDLNVTASEPDRVRADS